MSVQSAKEFLVKIATDEQLATRAEDAQRGALLGLAQELGYAFSDGDLSSAMEDVDELDKLSDADLRSIAGGRARRFADS
ncbi:MAG: Nif11-like leader peptide family RiPP precursor [Acidobacteria bacterium]|nr:Nif11-like leader peptide family RiPP precursor [Acidobacteriota bacterium]